MLRTTFGVLVLAAAAGADDLKPADRPPPWQRMLKGDDEKTAADLEKRLEDARQADKLDDAVKLAEEVLALRVRVQGADHWQAQDAERAVADLKLPLTADQKRQLGEAGRLNEEVVSLNAKGRYAEATVLAEKAARIRKSLLGDAHPDTLLSVNNLAALYRATGRHADAEPLYRAALAGRRTALGDAHPDTLLSVNNLAALYRATGRHADAEPLLRAAARGYEAGRLARAAAVERAVGAAAGNPYPPLAVAAAALGRPAGAFAAAEADAARGLLDELASRRGAGLTDNEEKARSVAAVRLAAIDARLLRLATQPKPTDAEQAERESLTADRRRMTDQLADLAATVSRREVADLPAIQRSIPADAALVAWVDVSDHIGRIQEHWGCVFRRDNDPHWERLPGTGPDGKWTAADRDLPATLRLALAASVSPQDLARITTQLAGRPDQLRAVTAAATSPAELDALRRRLFAQRLAPLARHLAGVNTLFVVPVHEMAGVPVEALTADYTVHYVPSGTFLARRSDRPKPAGNALLAVGDPKYPPPTAKPAVAALPPGGLLVTLVVPGGAAANAGLKPGDVLVKYAGKDVPTLDRLKELVAAHATAATNPIDVWRDGTVSTRDVPPGKLGVVLDPDPAPQAVAARRQSGEQMARLTRGGDWDELPGTAVELAGLRGLVPDCTVLARADAGPARLNALRDAGGLARFRYLHVAAHGEANGVRAFESALILSGDEKSVARLTAREVLETWKLDADLVTLSACETGVGLAAGGDGLLGFAQAFLIAGSRSVCLSLWKVDDAATGLLMDRFYRNLLGKRDGLDRPLGKAAALAEAKRWLRELPAGEAATRAAALSGGVARGKGEKAVVIAPPAAGGAEAKPFAHPRYWAAFVLIGDPD